MLPSLFCLSLSLSLERRFSPHQVYGGDVLNTPALSKNFIYSEKINQGFYVKKMRVGGIKQLMKQKNVFEQKKKMNNVPMSKFQK